MTQEEAKATRCIGSEGCGESRLAPTLNNPHTLSRFCIGSACMGWRWSGGWPLPSDPPAIRDRYEGYCGIAGKP